MSELTYDDIVAALERVVGTVSLPRRVLTHDQYERQERQAERGQSIAEGRMFAQPYEMDGRAADEVYGREPAGDWRMP